MSDTRTYIRIIPDRRSIGQIVGEMKRRGVDYADFVASPHCTIIYSKQVVSVGGIALPEIELPVIGARPRLSVFDTPDGRCLVVEFDCEALEKLHYEIKTRYGLATQFEAYRPHMTMQLNASQAVESLPPLPKMSLHFYKIKMDNGK
ncbi:MAG: hypothetical protein LBL46_01830 [Rickettsiales bacterium]|jgi:2'-5' RNA ligase|nr:hypothetical protein [Rickettsiales bacterium]